jgi:hypothetical protein
MEIPKQLKDDIWDYCRANNITNIDEFTVKLIRQGFTAEKYGSTPVVPKKEIPTPKAPIEEIELINLEIPENIKKHNAIVKKVKNKVEAEIKENNKKMAEIAQQTKKDLYGE